MTISELIIRQIIALKRKYLGDIYTGSIPGDNRTYTHTYIYICVKIYTYMFLSLSNN